MNLQIIKQFFVKYGMWFFLIGIIICISIYFVYHHYYGMDSRQPEVYNIQQNIYTYKEAIAICKRYSAKLATAQQVIEAYKQGANWCNIGWSDQQLGLYPIQEEYLVNNSTIKNGQCGKFGVNGGYYSNGELKFGANCFGIKPPIGQLEIDIALLKQPVDSNYDILKNHPPHWIVPYNKNQWSRYNIKE